MFVILRNDFLTASGSLVQRSEPWTEPKEVNDDLVEYLPSSAIIVSLPAGYRFKEGVNRKKATRKDIERVEEAPVDNSEAIQKAKERLKG